MQHEIAVREGHALAHLGEQAQPRRHVQAALVAVDIEGEALDELHHQVRLAEAGHAAIEQPRDRRVLERRQNLPFGAEPGHQLRIRQPQIHDLHGDALLELVVGAPCLVDGCHAAAGDERGDLVVAEPQAQVRIAGRGLGGQPGVLGEQGAYLAGQPRVVPAMTHDGGLARFRREVSHFVEHGFDLLPAGGVHGDDWDTTALARHRPRRTRCATSRPAAGVGHDVAPVRASAYGVTLKRRTRLGVPLTNPTATVRPSPDSARPSGRAACPFTPTMSVPICTQAPPARV